jgi:DNA recombination protein RmuC
METVPLSVLCFFAPAAARALALPSLIDGTSPAASFLSGLAGSDGAGLAPGWPGWLLGLALLGAGALLGSAGFALGFAAGRSALGRARDAFAALAADALRDNTEGFLSLASERFQRLEESSDAEWSVRRKALDETVGPLREALDHYRRETLELERVRASQAGELGEQLRSLAGETARLAGAFRGPAARGRWGELTLRRTAELAGLTEHCDFAEQVTVGGPAGAQRPDMIVRMPGGRELAVDAKAPLDAYLAAAEAGDDDVRRSALDSHARQVRRHVDALASRDYASRLERAPDFVVLFLPDEGFLAAAVACDRGLVEHALGRGVVIATPATLYALLGAVARGWREARIEESTREVLAQARELDDRLGLFTEHLARVGTGLGRAVEAYNRAVGSFETRVLPQTRRMRELGVEGRREASAPERVALSVRAPASPPEDPGGVAVERGDADPPR